VSSKQKWTENHNWKHNKFRKHYYLSSSKLRGAIGESLEDVLRNVMKTGV